MALTAAAASASLHAPQATANQAPSTSATQASTQPPSSEVVKQEPQDGLPEILPAPAATAAPAGPPQQHKMQQHSLRDAHRSTVKPPVTVAVTTENKANPAAADDIVLRSARELAACLACDTCGDVMRDPVTAPECMHSFCHRCIDATIEPGGNSNVCPVCKSTGIVTVLGSKPYQHGKLQFDFMLADVIRKLFPRPEVEAAVEQRRAEETAARKRKAPAAAPPLPKRSRVVHKPQRPVSQAQRLQQEQQAWPTQHSMPPNTISPGAAAAAAVARASAAIISDSAAVGATTSHQLPQDGKLGMFVYGVGGAQQLAHPYLKVRSDMPVGALARFIITALGQHQSDTQAQLYLDGDLVQHDSTMRQVWQSWAKQHEAIDLFTLCYTTPAMK